LRDGETDELHLTYAQLDRRARAIAALLQEQARPADRALLVCQPGLDFTTALLGCLYAGLVAVPAYPPRPTRPERSLPRLRAIAADAQPSVVVASPAALSAGPDCLGQRSGAGQTPWVTPGAADDSLAERWREPAVGASTVALLQYTSGSTAQPKGVVISHGNLLASSAMIQQALQHSSESRGLIWLPPYHDMGLVGGLLQPFYAGFPVVLLPPLSVIQRPLRWLQAIGRHRATTSGGPNFAYDLCVRTTTPEQRAGLDLRCWDLAFVGAEPIQPATLERFTQAFEPAGFRPEAFYPCYGLAEATLLVTGVDKGRARPAGLLAASVGDTGANDSPAATSGNGSSQEASVGRKSVPTASQRDAAGRAASGVGSTASAGGQRVVSVGHGWLDQRIVIADPTSLTSCPDGQIGEIWVAGPHVAQGYWRRPEASSATFEAYLADSGDGPFLRTGDLGLLRAGELFVTGRLKDLLIVRGYNHAPQDVEQTAAACHPALRDGSGAAFTVEQDGEQRLVVALELGRAQRDLELDSVASAVRRAVAEQHDLQVWEVVLLRPGRLPRTPSGKVQRFLCRARYLDGSLQLAATARPT
jgi:acyl-CoA synthetase (AMP-forming)/AMP-acid ligase II